MSTLHLLRRICAAPVLTLGLTACGGGSEALLIPLFEFGFAGTTTGNVGVQVFFSPDTPTTPTGTFDFVNMNVDGYPQQLRYTGTWSGCTFSISTTDTVSDPIAASYNGSFTGKDSIELRPASGVGLPTITLQRQGTGTREAC